MLRLAGIESATFGSVQVVGFVPSKLNSERLPRKNILPLRGRPLVNFALDTLQRCSLTETVLFASDDEVTHFVEPHIQYRFVRRDPRLDLGSATVQDFVGSFLEAVPCDVVALLHITSPFISPATVTDCISAVTSGRHESAFAALAFHRFAWFRDKPLNYRLDQPTPRTQDLDPILVEQSGLYVFTRDLFERTQRRISDHPYIRVIDMIEGHDIDTPEEFELAEALMPFVWSRNSA